MACINERLLQFVEKITQMESDETVPGYFRPFLLSFKEIMGDINNEFDLLSAKIAINSKVLEVLKVDRDKLQSDVRKLEIELEDAKNYSRRNCLLIHGVEEERGEKTHDKVLEIVNKQLGTELSLVDIER